MLHYSDLSQTFDPSLSQQPKLSLTARQPDMGLQIKAISILPLVVKNEGSQVLNQVEVAVFMAEGLLYAGGSPKDWLCSQRQQIVLCTSVRALQPGESLELSIPIAASYRVLQSGASEIEARFINHPGAEFEESVFVGVEMVWGRTEVAAA